MALDPTLGAFAQATWIGLAVAAPVGPIGVLVIQRSLAGGFAVGLATGLGAAVADAAYGALGAFGVWALVAAMQSLRLPLALAGGAVLLWLAWRTWRDAPAAEVPDRAAAPAVGAPDGAAVPAVAGSAGSASGVVAAFATTVALTLANPATVFSFLAIFGAMAGRGAVASPAVLVAGVFLGSALWWLALSATVSAMGRRIGGRARRAVAAASAVALALFALWQLAQAFWGGTAAAVG